MADNESPAGSSPGPGVDRYGVPVIDPTKNVLQLVEAAIQRQDDLRAAEAKHIRELNFMRDQHATELRQAEANRINAIRDVDVAAVQRTAEVQAAMQDRLAQTVTATAEAMRSSLATALEPIRKDIADLRQAQYEAAGSRSQVGESRLSVNTMVAIAGLVITVVLVIASIAGIIIANQ